MVTFAISWGFWVPTALFKLPIVPGYFLVLFGAFAPSISGVAVIALAEGKVGLRELLRRVSRWRVGVGWYFVVLFLMAIVVLAAILVDFVFGVTIPSFALLGKSWFLLPAVFLQVFLIGGPLQEELGWRGCALPRLQKTRGALVASLIVGLFWALWHLPLFWIPGSSQYGLPMAGYLLHFFPLAILFTWVYNNTDGSVLMTMLFHTAFNVTTYILPVTPQAVGNPLVFYSAVGLLWIVAAVVVVIFGPSCLSRKKIPRP